MTEQEQLLSKLLDLTSKGLVRWRQTAPDDYEGSARGHSFSIRFEYPLLSDETTSGADLASVTIGRIQMTFFNGTEGMRLVRQILTAGLDKWTQHSEQLKECYAEAEQILQGIDGQT